MTTDLTKFPDSMIAACETALDKGIFYQTEFDKFVIDYMGGYGCEAVLISEEIKPNINLQVKREILAKLEDRVINSPRGHYILIQGTFHDGPERKFWKVMVSDGTKELATGGHYDTYLEIPPPEKILDRMVGYEIYTCRDLVEKKRRAEVNIRVLHKNHFTIGQQFKNIRISGSGTPFSTASITHVSDTTGSVTLFLTRRGTKKKWTACIGASELESEIQRQAAKLAKTAIETPQKQPVIDLFTEQI